MIAKAIGIEMSLQSKNNPQSKLGPIGWVLRLMGKYVDSAAYLPLLCPRILGKNSKKERRNYAMVLSSLIRWFPCTKVNSTLVQPDHPPLGSRLHRSIRRHSNEAAVPYRPS